MEFALPTAVAALVLIFVYRRLRHHRRATVAVPSLPIPAGRATVVLDVGDVGAGSERVRRLVQEAAGRVLAESRDVSEVEVRSRAGALLGRVTTETRQVPAMTTPLVQPRAVYRSARPSPSVRDELSPSVVPRFEVKERPAPTHLLADSFDLPETVRSRIADPNNPVEIVRAILDAAGLPVSVDGDAIRCGDETIVVLAAESVRSLMRDALNHAYLRFYESGGVRGVVISLGYVDPSEVYKRELLAPALRHSGSEAIQRMADAVSIGANPLAFAAAPPVIATTRAPAEESARRSHRKAG